MGRDQHLSFVQLRVGCFRPRALGCPSRDERRSRADYSHQVCLKMSVSPDPRFKALRFFASVPRSLVLPFLLTLSFEWACSSDSVPTRASAGNPGAVGGAVSAAGQVNGTAGALSGGASTGGRWRLFAERRLFAEWRRFAEWRLLSEWRVVRRWSRGWGMGRRLAAVSHVPKPHSLARPC